MVHCCIVFSKGLCYDAFFEYYTHPLQDGSCLRLSTNYSRAWWSVACMPYPITLRTVVTNLTHQRPVLLWVLNLPQVTAKTCTHFFLALQFWLAFVLIKLCCMSGMFRNDSENLSGDSSEVLDVLHIHLCNQTVNLQISIQTVASFYS